MMQVPDAPWIRNAERYGTAYRDAWVWGYGDDDDYDYYSKEIDDSEDYEDDEQEDE